MNGVRHSLLLCLFGLSACGGGGDWRPQQVALAEEKIRDEVHDSNVRFRGTQFTGDQSTGQTCGYVTLADGSSQRFIVFIDNSAGPFVENDRGSHPVSQPEFDLNWKDQCLDLGYRGQ